MVVMDVIMIFMVIRKPRTYGTDRTDRSDI